MGSHGRLNPRKKAKVKYDPAKKQVKKKVTKKETK